LKKSFTTDAINLKNYPLNDNDSIVVMFSKTKGLIKAVAKGAKKPKSKLGARIQSFVANKLMLSEGKNLDTIIEAQSHNTFYKLRYDLDKLSYSMYIAEVVNSFCSKNFNNDENYSQIYDLIFNSYKKITESSTKEEILLTCLKFQIKIMSLLGWGLDFSTCSICQNELNDDCLFSFETGSFSCYCCSVNQIACVKINNKIRIFLKEISDTDIMKSTKYDSLVNMLVLEKCFNFMKKYISNISNKKTKIFDVLNSTTVV